MDRSSLSARDLTPFIGRKADLADLAALLTDPDIRLVTVTGAGGIGKTRLARAVIHEVAPDFSDGAAFVDLVAIARPELTPEAIAAAMNIALPGSVPSDEALIAELEQRNTLLILDNMEHLLPAVPFVERLLLACPDLVILATSRQRLETTGERVFELRPLSSPDQFAPATVDAIMQSESVQLFMQHAQAVDRAFALTEANAGEVAALCRRLDGLPLAIELAAAQVAEIPLRTMLRSFASILPFLEGPEHARDSRHRTMSNAIAWSYNALPPEKQRLMRSLAVFSGGSALPAIESIALSTHDAETTPAPSFREALVASLGELINRHLLIPVAWDQDEPRYDMLQTVREFCLARLAEADEESGAREAHARYFLDFAEPHRRALQGPDPNPSLRQFALEMDNFRAALGWATGEECDDPLLALRLCNRLAHYWLLRRSVAEARRWYALALAKSGEGETIDHATAYLQLGNLAYSDIQESFNFYAASLDAFRALQHDVGIARLLICLGDASLELGEYSASSQYLEEAVVRSEQLEDEQSVAYATYWLGRLAARVGKFEESKAQLERARSLWEDLGDLIDACYAIREMGSVYRLEGRLDAAEQIMRWCLDRLSASNIELDAGPIHTELGKIAIARSDYITAQDEYRIAGEMLLQTRLEESYLADLILCFADAAQFTGRYEIAVEFQASVSRWAESSHAYEFLDENPSVAQRQSISRDRLSSEDVRNASQKGGNLRLAEALTNAMRLEFASLEEIAEIAKSPSPQTFNLTNQEHNILCRISHGDTNRRIADSLFISERTVAVHVQNILRKLDADNRTNAAAIAFNAGICR